MTENKARRSGRITLAVPILLIGSDSEGRVFTEETHTVVLSLHGAGIVSRKTLFAEQELILREKSTSREAEIRVVGKIGKQEGLYTYAAAFVDETLHFWQMDFPPGAGGKGQAAALMLECSGCREMMELTNGDYEYDICAIHGGLARYCEDCGLLTVWRRTEEPVRKKWRVAANAERTEAGLVTELAQQAEMSEPKKTAANVMSLAEAAERRSRIRAKVNFFACVRTDGFGNDIVRCIDMSRGGVSFRSEHGYTNEMVVEIAVPFSAEVREAPAIFVRGRIANVRRMEGGEVSRCGLEFLRW